jgi:hypothetical protein
MYQCPHIAQKYNVQWHGNSQTADMCENKCAKSCKTNIAKITLIMFTFVELRYSATVHITNVVFIFDGRYGSLLAK